MKSTIAILSFALLAVACGPSGSAPQVQPLEDRIVAVSEEVVIRVDASDPDGDTLSYSYDTDVPGIRSRASLAQLPIGAGEFRWTPMASDVGVWFFDFKVSDGDYTTTVTVQVDVRSAVGANSAPRFLQPVSNGTTLDLGENRCISLDVQIDDPDSVEVDIEQAEPIIDGAEFSQTSELGGRWNWCPTPEQINASNRHTLSLVADDGDNPPTVLHYLIVLRRPAKDNCPGAAPVVSHTEMDQNTLGNIVISADVSDDKGLKDSPIVFYTETQPGTTPNLSAMSLATMSKTSGDTWEATVPNPVASSGQGASTELYYVILARDDDDETGSCDHEVLSPVSGSYEITVTNPGGSGGIGLCEDCVADAQCGDGSDDLCVRVGGGGDSYCLSGCSGPSDCPSGYTCSAQAVESIEGASAKQCVPESQTCELECLDDDFENNDTRAQASMKDPIEPGSIDAKSCPLSGDDDDEDWYRIDLTNDADVDLALSGGSSTDLDLLLYDDAGVFVLGSAGFNSTESLSLCLSAGTYYVRIVANSVGANDYSLSYSAASSTCAAPICNDPGPEPNDSSDEATTVIFDGQGDYLQDAKICSGEEDWYELNLFDGETLDVLAAFSHADGDLDIAILADDGDSVLEAGVSTDDDELISFTLDDASCTQGGSPCIFYVAVVGYDGAQNDYSILLSVSQ